MKLRIFMILEGNPDGDNIHIFGTETARLAWFSNWVNERFSIEMGDLDIEQPEEPWEAFELMRENGYPEAMIFDDRRIVHPTARNLRAAAGNLLDQVYQMQGMFDDEDGTIQEAIDDLLEAMKDDA